MISTNISVVIYFNEEDFDRVPEKTLKLIEASFLGALEAFMDKKLIDNFKFHNTRRGYYANLFFCF